jgi:hypothetical protein
VPSPFDCKWSWCCGADVGLRSPGLGIRIDDIISWIRFSLLATVSNEKENNGLEDKY